MNIGITLIDPSYCDWTHSVVFYTSGYLKGYIQGTVEVYDKESESAYTAEFLFRVYDPENGNSLTMVSFSETPKAIIKDKVAEIWELLNEQLIVLSLAAKLKSLLTADIPHNYSVHDYNIKEDTNGFTFYIDESSGYDLSSWTIPEAINYYDTPEAIIERDIAERRAWGFYD